MGTAKIGTIWDYRQCLKTIMRPLQNPSWFPLEAGHHEGFCKEKWRMLWE